jgi:septum site-determining protein MinC
VAKSRKIIMTSQPSIIQIKGIREGLLVTFGEADWVTLSAALIAQIDEKPTFYQSARMALDVGSQVLHVSELVTLRDVLSERGITVWAVISNSATTEQTAQYLGLATRISKPKPITVRESVEANQDDKALWIQHTLRSGSRIEFAGNVIVFGDVNPGAEIIAGGSILVWGRLRGLVHAGAQGNPDAVVSALEFSPTQLRIAGEIAVSPKKESKGKVEIARLKEGHLIAEPWKPGH